MIRCTKCGNPTEQLFGTAKTASLLHIDVKNVKRMCADGRLRGAKKVPQGKREVWQIPESAVLDVYKQHFDTEVIWYDAQGNPRKGRYVQDRRNNLPKKLAPKALQESVRLRLSEDALRPLCDCHNEPEYWIKSPNSKPGGYWVCAVQMRWQKENSEQVTETSPMARGQLV
jgi:hypothetical protein